jgi:hypothetical protein
MTLDRQGKPVKTGMTNDESSESPEEIKKRKFAEAIKEAERSTLCFNLDMGNVPLQNKTTIQEKAALALTSMAARKEGKNSAVPSSDAITAIDDFASMVTSMEFYGSNTKQYKGKTDKPFCTVPVRYHFKDRDTRVFAEKTLRDTCEVNCTTPYPAIVRESIKQVVDHVKKSHPEDFIKVNVMTKEFGLKISRRPKGKDLPWYTYPDIVPLPEAALDVTARKVPEGFRIETFPCDYELIMDSSSPPHSPKQNLSPKPGLTALLKNKK